MNGAGKPSGRSLSDEAATRKRGRSLAALGYFKPQTYEELRAVLSSGTVHFPKRLRQVAIFMWQHPSDVALGTIAQVAAQAGVQPSTLVRFAQIFGYSGFSDFQGLFKEHVKGSWPEARGEPRTEAEPNATMHFLHGMVGASQASLGRIEAGFDVESFEKMVTLLAAADAVLAVSFSPYNSITPDLVAVAHERKARIVTITDSTFSPLIPLSDSWLEVVESDFAGFRSLAASLAVGMALVQGVAAKRGA